MPTIPAKMAHIIRNKYSEKSKPRYPKVMTLRPCWKASTRASVEINGLACKEKELSIAAIRGAVPPIINDKIIDIVEPRNK